MRRRQGIAPSESSSARRCSGRMQWIRNLGETVNNFGLLGGDRLSLAQGALEPTGNPLDLAIEGQGFFMVQTPNGPALYARRQLSSRAERPTRNPGRRAGALRGRKAHCDSAG